MNEIYSLTGFAQNKSENFKYTIKSYNSRFLEINFQIPDFIQQFEKNFKEKVQGKIKRGKIYIKIEANSFQLPFNFKINKELLGKFISIFKEINPEIQNFPFGILQKESFILFDVELNKKIIKEIEDGFEKTISKFLKSRKEEGKKLKKIILTIAKDLKNNLSEIRNKLPKLKENIYNDLKKQIETIFENYKFDENRIAQEVVFLSMKLDAKEEIERAIQFTERIIEKIQKPKGFQGKEIDFLTQEILRELQTLSQKIKDIKLREKAISCKLLNEQIREQVQNLE